MNILSNAWYQKKTWCKVLLPLSLIYYCIISLRKLFYSIKLFKSTGFDVPVIIVGNISVGGTGKTPLVIALVNHLKQQGLKPAVISRGYGGRLNAVPTLVTQHSQAGDVGDEPLEIFRNTQVPVIISKNRVAAAQFCLDHHPCNVIISDDGLQHYALARDVEIIVIDGMRRLGNGFLLPAGPLREPKRKLNTAEFIINNSGHVLRNEISMSLVPHAIHPVNAHASPIQFENLAHKRVAAVAGIGNPDRFFRTLKQQGIAVQKHFVFPDHYAFNAGDIDLNYDVIIMTAKDATKCESFADHRHYFLSVKALLPDSFYEAVLTKIKS